MDLWFYFQLFLFAYCGVAICTAIVMTVAYGKYYRTYEAEDYVCAIAATLLWPVFFYLLWKYE